MRRICLMSAIVFVSVAAVQAQTGDKDVADVPSRELAVKDQPDMKYFLIGPKAGAKEPADGYSLLVVMPGGGGGADFNPFVRRIMKYALGPDYLVAQPIAVKWTAAQRIVWPLRKNEVEKMQFSTEDFGEAVIKEVAQNHKVNPKRVFTLSWSSSGPAAYAIALQPQTAVTGSMVTMSVWHPDEVPDLANARGRPFYIYHSPKDTVCRIRLAQEARKALEKAGAKVKFVEYQGGHGWTSGSPFEDIAEGMKWLENAVSTPEKEKPSRPSK